MRNRRSATLGLVGLSALVLLASACADLLSPDEHRLRVSLSLAPVTARDTVIMTPTEHQRLPPVTGLEVAGGTLRVSGYFATPCAREQAYGRAVRSGKVVTLHLVAVQDNPDVCLRKPTPYLYDAYVSTLAPGEYRLQMAHSYTKSDLVIIAYEADFTVE